MTYESRFIEKSPIISCIMPVYNCEKYLRQSIRSILDQTFSDFEFIIVNDGSTDSSPNIIEEMRLADQRIIVINQINKGSAAARNAGLNISRGEFIACMDADDISTPDRFRVQYEFLLNNSDVVLVGGLARTNDGCGGPSLISTGNRNKTTNLLCFPPKIVTAVHPLIMVRAKAFKSICGYDSHYLYVEDYEMLLRISRLGRIAHIDNILLDYRIHGENISVRKLALQEKEAATAEIFHVQTARNKVGKRELRISEKTFEAYVSIRILRRELGLGKLIKPKYYFIVLYNLFKGSISSELYSTIRLLLLLCYHAARSVRLVIKEWFNLRRSSDCSELR